MAAVLNQYYTWTRFAVRAYLKINMTEGEPPLLAHRVLIHFKPANCVRHILALRTAYRLTTKTTFSALTFT